MLSATRTPVRPSLRLLAPALAALLLLAGGAAAAQELKPPKPHQGYYIGLGAYGVAGVNRDRLDGWLGGMVGPGASLRVGEALFDWLDLGVGFASSWIYQEEYWALVGHVSFEVQLRPVEPLFTRLSVGFGFTDITRREQGLEKQLGRIGGSYGLAVGWDFFPGHDAGETGGIAITPVIWFEAGPSEEFTTLVGGVGIEITWWTGLPKERLELPVEEAFEKEP